MILDLLKYAAFGVLVLFLLAFLYSKRNETRLSAQGVVFMRFGFIADFIRLIVSQKKDPYRIFLNPIFEAYFGKENIPNVTGINLFGYQIVVFNRVECLDELYVKKNAFMTKHESGRSFGVPLFTDNVVAADSKDPNYKLKRKSLSAAFFKNKVQKMIITVKETALRIFKEVQDKGDRVEQYLVKITTRLQNHIITSIMLG